MASRTLSLALAATCLAALASTSSAQLLPPATLMNGGFENPDLQFGFGAQGWRLYNFTAWRAIGDGLNPPTQVHSGTHSYLIPGGQGRPNGEFEAVQAEDLLNLNLAWDYTDPPTDPNYNPRNWAPYNITFTLGSPNTVTMQPLNIGYWYMIPASDPVVVSQLGMKIGMLRNDPNDFGYFQSFEWLDLDPNDPTTPTRYPGIVMTTATGPYATDGSTITLPAIHTNGVWLHYTKQITQSEICTDFGTGGTCPTPPGPINTANMVYYGPVVSLFAERYDQPVVTPCGGTGQPVCTRNRSYGSFWVDDYTFVQGNPCPADFNGDGHVTVQDIFSFLTAWFAKSPTADFNGDGNVTVQDIFSFLTAWFAGCH